MSAQGYYEDQLKEALENLLHWHREGNRLTKQDAFKRLTKNPDRYQPLSVDSLVGGWMNRRPNWWFGTTVTGEADLHRIWSLQASDLPNLFISFEPLLGDPGPLDLTGIKQVIIGAQTNPIIPVPFEPILKIQDAADRAGAKVFCKKDSLSYLNVGDKNNFFRRELCWNSMKAGVREP